MSESRVRWFWMGLAGALTVVALAGAVAVSAQGVVSVSTDNDDDDDESSVYFVGTGRHSAYLGVRLEEETEWAEGGARVTNVVDGSPADDAGLEVGDIVVSFDGKTIRGPVALTGAIHEKDPGDTVELRVVRDGREEGLTVELADRGDRLGYVYAEPFGLVAPELNERLHEKIQRSLETLELPRAEFFAPCDDDEEDCAGFNYRFLWSGRPRLGVQLVDTTPELREHLGSTAGEGVLVGKVLRGTPAEHAGVRVGDLIVRVGDAPVEDVSDLREALAEQAGETFEIEVVRDKKTVSLEVTLPETDAEAVTGPRAALPAPPPAPPVPGVEVTAVAPPVAGPAPPAAPAPPAPRAVLADDGTV